MSNYPGTPSPWSNQPQQPDGGQLPLDQGYGQPGQFPATGPHASQYPGYPPPKTSRTGLLIGWVAAAVILLVVGVAGTMVLLGDDTSDSDKKPAEKAETSKLHKAGDVYSFKVSKEAKVEGENAGPPKYLHLIVAPVGTVVLSVVPVSADISDEAKLTQFVQGQAAEAGQQPQSVTRRDINGAFAMEVLINRPNAAPSRVYYIPLTGLGALTFTTLGPLENPTASGDQLRLEILKDLTVGEKYRVTPAGPTPPTATPPTTTPS